MSTQEKKDLFYLKTNDLAGAEDESKVRSDRWNYVLLVFLYVLQGIFGGLLHAIPFILQEKNEVSYGDQALLRLGSVPGWSKLLWAPLIECIYHPKIGKRKSWVIPCQYLLGLIILFSSFKIETWLGHAGEEKPNILAICLVFFFSEFLLTTLDMVVDSWALTMLRRENVGYQATCNIIGNRVGYFFGYVLVILLRSEEISAFLGKKTAILSLSGYLLFWSVVLLIGNTGVLFFKKDTSLDVIDKNEEQLSIRQSYKLIWDILNLKSVRQLSVILLLCKAGVGPIIGLTNFKLIRGGLKTDKLVLLSIPLIPLQSILPFILRRYFEGSKGLERFSRTLIYMVPVGIMFSVLLYCMPYLKNNGKLTATFYIAYFIVHGLEYMVMFLMAAGFMSFISKISDPKYGAVYLTVIQTIRLIGFMWPLYLSLGLVEPLTFYKRGCVKENDKRGCVLVDGYCILVLLGSLFSICFLRFGGLKAMLRIQNWNESVWRISVENK